MKSKIDLAASNIGWAPETKAPGTRAAILPQLYARGVTGLVIAPSMVWEGAPDTVTVEQASTFRREVNDNGLRIVGLQSLTYGLEATRLTDPVVIKRLKRQAELAGRLGATSLILGSPNLRQQRPDRSTEYNKGDVVEALVDIAEVAADHNTRLCIEPLSGYGVNHVTSVAEGVQLTWEVGSYGIKAARGFGLHLDAAALAGDPSFESSLDIPYAQVRGVGGITSFDASAPNLMPPSQDSTIPHGEIAAALRGTSTCARPFNGFISLEMRQPEGTPDPVAAYLAEIDFVSQQYGFNPQQ